MGKRKIEIKEIKDDRQKRSVTFTKRRDGLFKKAETACQKFGGLQIGILVFSPAGKPFTFTNSSSSSSSSISVDEIIDRYYMSSTSSTSSSAVVMGGKRRSRSDDDDVQVIETEKKKKKQKTMNAVVTTTPPPCSITVQEEEDEKLDEGLFHWDQTHDDQELRNEFLMGLVEEGNTYSWAPPDVVELQEIINVEDDDFEYDNDDHHHDDEDETTTMGLLPPPPPHTTSTSLCNSISDSDVNEDEVGGANEDDGYTLEEWENILSASPTVGDSTVVGHSMLWSSSCLIQEVVPAAWPTQEFLQLLCS